MYDSTKSGESPVKSRFTQPYGFVGQQQKLLGNKREARVINGERGIPGRPKVVRVSKVPLLTSHAGLNPWSKSGYGREARVIKKKKSYEEE